MAYLQTYPLSPSHRRFLNVVLKFLSDAFKHGFRHIAGDRCREVKVLGKDGAPETSDTSRKILSLLYKQLK